MYNTVVVYTCARIILLYFVDDLYLFNIDILKNIVPTTYCCYSFEKKCVFLLLFIFYLNSIKRIGFLFIYLIKKKYAFFLPSLVMVNNFAYLRGH